MGFYALNSFFFNHLADFFDVKPLSVKSLIKRTAPFREEMEKNLLQARDKFFRHFKNIFRLSFAFYSQDFHSYCPL